MLGRVNYEARARRAGKFFAWAAGLAMGLVAMGAMHMVFPGLPLGWLIFFGVCGWYVETKVFNEDVPYAFLARWGKGFWPTDESIQENLEIEMAVQELQHQAEHNKDNFKLLLAALTAGPRRERLGAVGDIEEQE